MTDETARGLAEQIKAMYRTSLNKTAHIVTHPSGDVALTDDIYAAADALADAVGKAIADATK